ncbi:hypothetical protein T265_12782, partial [Opisthorchis viverrini]
MVEHRKASLQEPDDNGRLPIHVAAVSGQPDVLTYLINAVSQRLLLSNVPGRFRLILEDGSGDGMSDSDDEKPGGDLSLGLQVRHPSTKKDQEKLRRRSVNAYRMEQLYTARTVAAANYLDIHHWTPLHHASCEEAINRYPECLKILLKNGADPMLPTLQGKTALDLAYAAGRSQVLVDVLPKRQLIALLMQIDDIVPLRVRTGQVPVIPQLHTKLLSAEKPDVAPPQLIVPQRSEREGSIPRTPSERARKGYSFIRRLADTMGDEEITSHHMWKAKGGKSESTNLMSIWRKILLNDNVELLETLRDSLVWRQNKQDSCAGDVDFHAVTQPTESTATTMTDFDSAQRLTSKQLAELFNDCYENGTGVFSHVQANYQNLIRARDFLTVLRAMTGLLTFNTLTTHTQYPTSTPSVDDVEILRPMHKSLLFLAILCGRFRVAEQLLRMRQFDMLPAAVLVLLILRRLRKEPSFPQQVLTELGRYSERIEAIAVDVLNIVFLKDKTPEKKICRNLLQIPLRSFGNVPLIDLCARAKGTKLLSLPYFQRLLDERWDGVLVHIPSLLRLPVQFFPFIGLIYLEYKARQERSAIARQRVRDTLSTVLLSTNKHSGANSSTTTGLAGRQRNSSDAPDVGFDSDPWKRLRNLQSQGKNNFILPKQSQREETVYNRMVAREGWRKFPRCYFILGVYLSPSTKFMYHAIFHLCFLIIFSAICLYHITCRTDIFEALCLAYVAGYGLEEARQFLFESLRDGWKEYIQDKWNWIDLLAVGLTALGFWAKNQATYCDHDTVAEAHDESLLLTRNFYMMSLVLFDIRTLNITSIFQTIGPRLKMMSDMLRKDLIPLLVVFAIFIISYGVWFQGLLFPNGYYKNKTEGSGSVRMEFLKASGELLKRAFYNLFDIGIILSEESDCGRSVPCGYETGFNVVLYFVFVLYTGIVNIILINLLIALFSNTVSRIELESTSHWMAGRYKMIKEYSERTPLPPPLNVFCILYEVIYCSCYQCYKYVRNHFQGGIRAARRQRKLAIENHSDSSSDQPATSVHTPEIKKEKRLRHRNTRRLEKYIGTISLSSHSEKHEIEVFINFIILQSFALRDQRYVLGLSSLDGAAQNLAASRRNEFRDDGQRQDYNEAFEQLNQRLAQLEALVLSELDRFTDRIESIAVDLLNLVSFKDNTPEKMICHDMLNIRLRTFGNLSLVDLFAIAKCNGLLGLPCTQFLLDERWYGVLTYVPNWVRWLSRVFPLVGLLYVEIKDRQDRCNCSTASTALIGRCCASTASTALIGRQMSVQDDNSLSSKQAARANKITKHAKWTDAGNSYSTAVNDKAYDDRPVKSVYAQSPEPVITIYQRITSQNEESSKSPRMYFLTGIYRSPSMKFCLHSLFHLLFLWCFSVVCFYHLHFDFSIAEIIALAYVAGYAIEEIRQILLEGLKDGWAEYLKDGWNWIDILAVSLTGVGFCVRMNAQKKTDDPLDESRDQILYAARNVYMLGLNLFYMRTLHITSISQVIGPRLKMMADMLRKDLLPMILVFVIFIFSFGVWFQGLIHPNDFYKSMAQMEIYTRERRHEGQKLPGSFKKMIKRAFYSIFEVSIVIDEQHCDDSKECGSERGMEIVLYFVLVLYTWIVNIILINLLIALFSNTVSRIDQKAAALWLAGRYKMVKEYSERTLLPPPLNILCVLLELLQFIVSQCKNCIRKRSNPKEEFSDTSAYGLTKEQSTYNPNDFRTNLRHTTWIRHALLNSNRDTTKQEVDAVLKFILLQSFALQNRRHILGTGLLGQGFISWPAGTQESENSQSQTNQELSQATTRINKRINLIEASLNIFLKKLSAVPHEAAMISNPKRLPRPLKMPSTRMIRTPSNASTVSVHIPTSSEIFASLSKQSSFSSPRVSLTRGKGEASRPDGLPEHEKPKAKP